jgi:hypothetical protein
MTKLFALLAIVLAARPAASPSPASVSPESLFSQRALRQARLIIQMRLLQLHDEQLECVREALLRRLPNALRPPQPSPARATPDASAAVARCARLFRF